LNLFGASAAQTAVLVIDRKGKPGAAPLTERRVPTACGGLGASTVNGGVAAESGQSWLRVDRDHDEGAGGKNEGESGERNKLLFHKESPMRKMPVSVSDAGQSVGSKGMFLRRARPAR
jgi:hypothetical protein